MTAGLTGPSPASGGPAGRRVLVVRLDSDGDVLLAGPAVRAVAAHARVTLLVSPAGRQAADLLPGVDDVLVWPCPWTGFDPPPVDPASIGQLVAAVAQRRPDAALVLTSYHQSPLPAALLLRMAGLPWIGAESVDYPGSLLDLRHRPSPDAPHEVQRMLGLAVAAGFGPPAGAGDPTVLAVRGPLPAVPPQVAALDRYVVLHPGASVPARAPDPSAARRLVVALTTAGHPVVVTGGPTERLLTRFVAGNRALDLGGGTDLATLAAVLAGAEAVVVGNTGPAHLAAAVGAPVVSLFAPVVPAERWAPWTARRRILGDQDAACANSRARTCPVPGHPCLGGIGDDEVVAAVRALAPRRTGTHLAGVP